MRQIILLAAFGVMTTSGYSQCVQPVPTDHCVPLTAKRDRLLSLLSSDALFGFVPPFIACSSARNELTVSPKGEIVLGSTSYSDSDVARHFGSFVHGYTHLWQQGRLPGKYGELQADYVVGYISTHYYFDDTNTNPKALFDEITRDGRSDPVQYGTLMERASAFFAGGKATLSSLRTVLAKSFTYYDDLSGCGTARALLAGSLSQYEGLTETGNDSPWTPSFIAPPGASDCKISAAQKVYRCLFPPDNLEDAGRRVRGIMDGFRSCAPPNLLVRTWVSSTPGGTAMMFWRGRGALRTVVDVFEQARGVTLEIRTLDPEPAPQTDTPPQEPQIPAAERSPEIVIGGTLRVSAATTRRLKSEADSLRATSRQMVCDDSCPVGPAMQAIANARTNTLKALNEAHYVAFASYADARLTRASSELTALPERLPRPRLAQILSKFSDVIDRLVEPESATITLRVSLLPEGAILQLWPIRYEEGGKQSFPSGALITVFRGKYSYEESHAAGRIAGELNLIDTKGTDLVCGTVTKPALCSVK